MLGHTRAIVAAAIGADNTITASRKKQIMLALETEGGGVINQTAIPRVYSRDEAGRVLGVSPKRIDQLVKIGALRKTYALGTTRAIGITHESLLALATGRGQGEAVTA